MEARPYQIDLAKRVHAALTEHQSVVMQLPTGSGKTFVAGMFAKMFAQKVERRTIALYLVHRHELATQTVRTLESFGLGDMVGRIQPGYPEARWKPFQVASLPTVARRLDDIRQWCDPLLQIVDEAHHARAATWETVLEAFPRAYRLGMTATPERLDGKGLHKHFNALVQGPSIAELQKDGYLAHLDLFAPPPKLDLKKLKRGGYDYSQKSQDELVDAVVIADAVANWQRLASDCQTLHFAVSVRHSQEFVERMRAIGVTAEHVDGTTDARLREQIFKRFDQGITQCLSNVDIATEGYDCPECRCVILARPTKSQTRYRQMAGRAMRPKASGKHGIIIDTCGVVRELGPPDDAVEWTLADGSVLTRESASKRAPYKQCPECDLFYPARSPACVFCGYAPEGRTVEEVDVNLVRWGNEPPPPKNPKRREHHARKEVNRRVIETGGDEEKLEALRLELGYKPGMIWQWKQIFRPIWAQQRRKDEYLEKQYDLMRENGINV